MERIYNYIQKVFMEWTINCYVYSRPLHTSTSRSRVIDRWSPVPGMDMTDTDRPVIFYRSSTMSVQVLCTGTHLRYLEDTISSFFFNVNDSYLRHDPPSGATVT